MIGIRNTSFLILFGKNLKQIRLSKNLTQELLAFNADIAISQIGRLERGEINATISTLLALSKALQIHYKELLEFEFKDI